MTRAHLQTDAPQGIKDFEDDDEQESIFGHVLIIIE